MNTSHRLGESGVCDLYCIQSPGGDQNILASLFKTCTMLCPQNAFTIVHDWQTNIFFMFASYNQLHIVNLLCSAPGTALPLRFASPVKQEL